MYKVHEIFYSIQGEGYWSGTPMIFVRFFGCNLSCDWCDTPQNGFREMSKEEILAEIRGINLAYGARINRVCFTGGEPLLQLDRILFDLIYYDCYNIHIETNGTIVPDGWLHMMLNFGWVTVSPKSSDESWKLRRGSELKVVYTGQSLKPYFTARHNFEQKLVFLQPCTVMKPITVAPGFIREDNTDDVVAIVKSNPTDTRLSIQKHKWTGMK